MDFQDYKHTHIPAFGNWDYEHGSPFTQHFESERQAGLLRYNCIEGDLYSYTNQYDYDQYKDLYMQPTHTVPPRRKSKTKEAREKSDDYCQSPHLKEQKKQRKVYDVVQTARQHQERLARRNDGRLSSKAVDEDLYKIPPEQFLKKKKVFGFFSSCLVPSCAA